MNIAVQLEPAADSPRAVEYRWDTDTDILSAHLASADGGNGTSGSVELEGTDGSWLILDVAHGRISGLEVAVWPNVQRRPMLDPPTAVEDAHVLIPLRSSMDGPLSLEVTTLLAAEADTAERVIHFRVGARRDVRTVRLGRDLLLDLDPQSRIAGVWLLNVPPFPSSAGRIQ
ncbi:MAG: hypothetical protein M3Z10_08370 [Gemmatimonadota bacterium]|nr:hypothetical protein [Gemmatimonadota bacterium]